MYRASKMYLVNSAMPTLPHLTLSTTPRGGYFYSQFKKRTLWLGPCPSWTSITEFHYHEIGAAKYRLWPGVDSISMSLWVLKHKCQKTRLCPDTTSSDRCFLRSRTLQEQERSSPPGLQIRKEAGSQGARGILPHFLSGFFFFWSLFCGRSD